MNKLAILSRDAWQYHELIKQAQLPELELLWASNKPPLHHDFSSVDILLADPDLAAVELQHCESLKWLQSTWAGNAPLLNHPKRDYLLCGLSHARTGRAAKARPRQGSCVAPVRIASR